MAVWGGENKRRNEMKKSMLKDVGGEPMKGVRRLLAALMVGLMMVSGAKLPVMATEGQEAHEYIPPENPRWDETKPGVGYIDIVDPTKGYVVAALYKDGKQISTSRGSSDGTSTRSYTFNTNMNYSGIYTFKVKMSADNSDGSRDMSYGAVSVESAPFVYNRPSEELATPVNLRWSSEQQKVGEWDPVEHAQSYMAILSRDDQFVIGLYSPASITKANFSQYMADTEGHTYTFRVIAYSEDINKWANSNNSAASEPYGGTSQAQAIQNNIASAANADENTVNDVVDQLKAQDNASAMCNAIQDSEATQQNLSKLENTYNQKNGITVNTNSEVEAIPTSGISVIGAGLNAEAGSTVSLNVSPTPTAPQYDTDIYKNVIAFDMKLVDVKGETRKELTKLDIPAVITLPIPAGLDTSDLFILHFKSDGSFEKITPAIIENGTKAKFTITSFSTFAFANENKGSGTYKHLQWDVVDGKSYWYENNVRQGTYDDPQGVLGDGTVRGREIYDPSSDAWYWLDSIYDGAKACGKEVWMPYIYQKEKEWLENEEVLNENAAASGANAEGNIEHAELADQVRKAIISGTGKWVRYDNEGKMFKGWVTIEGDLAALYPDQAGNTYYYDRKTGLMAKGATVINGKEYYFDEITGALK